MPDTVLARRDRIQCYPKQRAVHMNCRRNKETEACSSVVRHEQVAFLPTLPAACFTGEALRGDVRCTCTLKRRRAQVDAHRHASMSLFEPVHTLPEFLNQIVVSCGIGLMGIAGAKATQQARALTAGDRKAEHMNELAKEIDSFRRRRELADVKDGRDWDDVSVDRFANVVVEPELVPELESHDELEAFDRLLMESPGAQRAFANDKKLGLGLPKPPPGPTEFESEEDCIGK